MKWPAEHRAGVWGFLVAVAFIPGIMSAAFAGRWAVIALGVPLVAPIEFKFSPFVRFCLAFGTAWAAVSLIATPDLRGGAFELFFLIVLVGVMGAASQLESLEGALTGLCAGVGVSSLFCLSAMAGYPLVDQVASSTYAGLFYNSEVLTELAAPLFVWAVVSKRWPLAACTILPLLVNGSRISVIAVGIAALYAFRGMDWRRLAIVASVALAAIVAMLAYRYTGTLGSIGQRIVMWVATGMAITPLGNGIGWYRAVHLSEEFAHSDILQAMAELGVGAVCWAAIPVLIFWRNRGENAERAAFVALCVEAAVSFPLHVPATAFLAAILAGYLVRDRSVVRMGAVDGRIHDGQDGGRHAAYRGVGSFAGRRGYRTFFAGSSIARISSLGSARGCEAHRCRA